PDHGPAERHLLQPGAGHPDLQRLHGPAAHLRRDPARPLLISAERLKTRGGPERSGPPFFCPSPGGRGLERTRASAIVLARKGEGLRVQSAAAAARRLSLQPATANPHPFACSNRLRLLEAQALSHRERVNKKPPAASTGGFHRSTLRPPHSAGAWLSPAIRRWPANIRFSVRRPNPAISSTIVNTAGI